MQKFITEMLPGSRHTIISYDSQPVLDAATEGQFTLALMVAGSVKYQALAPKPFQQTFLITNMDGKWRVATDTFRMQETRG